MKQRILITGGAGFIGSHTVDLLLQQGKHVTVYDNLSTGKLANLDLTQPNLHFIHGNVLDQALLESAVRDCDVVLHLAAISSVQVSCEDPIQSFQVNSLGFIYLLDAIKKINEASGKNIRLVYASSAAIYGNPEVLPCCDKAERQNKPLSPYALQKNTTEDYAHLYRELYRIPSLGLRYFNVYGKRQDPESYYSGVLARFMHGYQKNATLTIYGDGKQSRDFIHVSDVARANSLAIESDYEGVLNIATGNAVTLLDILDALSQIGNKPVKHQFENARVGDIKHSYAAVEKAVESLSFKAKVNLLDGLKMMVG